MPIVYVMCQRILLMFLIDAIMYKIFYSKFWCLPDDEDDNLLVIYTL